MKKSMIIAAVVVAAIAIPATVYAASPLFINTTVDEPLPGILTDSMEEKPEAPGSTVTGTDNNGDTGAPAPPAAAAGDGGSPSMEGKEEGGSSMGKDSPAPMMEGEGKEVGEAEEAPETDKPSVPTLEKEFSGSFVGVNDGVHNAEGLAKVLALEDGSRVLRLQDFKATNGPDLYVYLATDKGASDYVNVGRLKGNIGNQNYDVPEGVDLEKYDTVLIWCQAFSVLFGSAELAPVSA